MEVVEFLKAYGIEQLKKIYSIQVKECGSLFTFNYSIKSPKYHPITRECRGLILDKDFNVVSRSFDRFFNYGEKVEPVACESYITYEKIDGSLIKIYYWNGKWNVSTRSMAFADKNVPKSTYSFKEFVFVALGGINEEAFQAFCDGHMSIDTTYIFELTCEENRIVTKYEGCTLWYLAARTTTGEYRKWDVKHVGIEFPKMFHFQSIEECIQAANNFQNFEEGFVIYDTSTGAPILKIKNQKYVLIHNNRKGNLATSDMIEMYLSDKSDEYISYFPETKADFVTVIKRVDKYLEVCKNMYERIRSSTDREFSKQVQPYAWKWIAFQAKKRKEDFLDVFHNSSNMKKKVQLLSTEHVILFVGISASGKSTAALEYEEMDYVDINRDKWRVPYVFNRRQEKLVTEKCDTLWEEAKTLRKNVVISDCNLKEKYHNLWKKRAQENGYNFLIRYFDVSLEQAIKNDLKRDRVVGKDAILKQWQNWLTITNKKKYVPNTEKPKVLICDIDGTIALMNGKRKPYQYSKVLRDSPRTHIIAMIRSWAKLEKLKVIFVSGREDYCREDTEEWLIRYFPEEKENLVLHMRQTKDYRRDSIVKEEIFWNRIVDHWNVSAVIDDRPQVIRMWHDIGIDPVINVQQGYLEF